MFLSDRSAWIIDTNVLVHWIMAKHVMSYVTKEFKLGDGFYDVYHNRYQYSSDCIDNALILQFEYQEFFITELSLNELFSGIRDEVRTIMLFVNGIPLSRWASKRGTREVKFPESLSKQIYEKTLGGLDALIKENKFKILPTSMPSDRKEYFDVYSSLIFLNPNLSTQDAMLIATAIFANADYFVTADKELYEIGKKIKISYNLQVLNPQQTCQKLIKLGASAE